MINELFLNPLHVINIGLSSFADSIRDAGGKVTHLDWRPPAGGNHDTGLNLATIINHPLVENANKVAFTRFLNAQPVLCGVGIARNVIPDLGDRTLLHAGPPIKWSQMCGPMKGAIVGAILFEGWAKTHQEAETYAASGKVKYAPCHHYSAVGPMAGIISPSMPVWIVENKDNGQKAFSNLNEGLGKVLRFGANDSTVLDRLKWMAEVLAPALDSALRYLGGIELRPIIAQALHMGDE